MKLKKIASLMLAGIMAVSMLAGCKSGTPVDDDPSSSEQPTTSNAATMLESEMSGSAKDKVTPVANADLDNALENAVEKYWNKDYKDYNNAITGDDESLNGTNLVDVRAGAVGKAVKDALKADYISIAGDEKNVTDHFNSDSHHSNKVVVEVYALDASVSDAYAMELLANKIDSCITELPDESKDTTGSDYNYTYTMSASISSRTENFAGVEFGIKYVAVMLTKNVAEKV